MLMELGVFRALEQVLGLYSNIAISWVGAVVADLVINKPLGLSPEGIEFRRAHLYAINPVGVGATLIASSVSVLAFTHVLGETAHAFSALIALATALIVAPAIAWATGGKYYIARQPAALAISRFAAAFATRSMKPKTWRTARLMKDRSALFAARWMRAVMTCANRAHAYPSKPMQ
jgi:hypothetical protein